MADTFFHPTQGTPKDPVPLLQKRIELLEGEVHMLHGKLQAAYRKLAAMDGQDPQQALEELLEELRKAEEKRLEREQAEAAQTAAKGADGDEKGTSRPKDRAPKGHGPRPQLRLEVIEELHELADEDCQCPNCGGALKPLGEQFEEYEEITVFERQYLLKQVKCRKYRCNCNGCVVTTPGPVRLVPGGRYSLDFAVQIAVDKYLDHQPLERQTRIMDRLGLEVSSQTLWDQIDALARPLESSYDLLGQLLYEAPLWHADETRWPRLDGSGQSPWTVWARCTPDIAYYKILGSKSAKAGRKLFSGYKGIVVVDGYAVYEKLARDGPGFRLANCWAHTRRKFEEIQPNFPLPCRKILSLIGKLYEIERLVESPFPGDEEAQRLRLRLRQERSKPVLSEIRHWAYTEIGLPRSELGKAVRYMIKRWDGLTFFTENALIPLDNNAAERSLRGPVVGRKVHYGSKSKRGTEVAALFYTLLETAKLCGVEPAHYLKTAALAALRQPGTALLPHHLRLVAEPTSSSS